MNFHDWLSLLAVASGPVTGTIAAKVAQRVDMAVLKTTVKDLSRRVANNESDIRDLIRGK